MLVFKDELAKYQQLNLVEEVEDQVRDEVSDIMDVLQYISKRAQGTAPQDG